MKNPSGICMCGCGNPTPLSPTSRRGYKRGEPLLFLKGHSSRKQGSEYREEARGFDTPCWIWQKHVHPRLGYGRTWDGEQVVGAHRMFYERHVGPIRDGLEIHHLCDQRDCVNPAHLEALTRAEHMATDGRPPYGNRRLHVLA